MTELTPETAVPLFEREGVVPNSADADAQSLGGGVSNRVIEVTWADGALVAKQPLPNLGVDADWPADVDRVHNEATATRAYAEILDASKPDIIESGHARVPEIRFEDSSEHIVAMERAPAEATMWKQDLLDGRVEPEVARIVGSVLGTVQTAVAGDTTIRDAFESSRPFEQLRLEPYHRTVAKRHPALEDEILRELERVAGVQKTLVHGDYSPKNILVDRQGTEPTVWVLDFEVAHWGDPAFDAAFMLNHLFIKSVYIDGYQDAVLEAAEAFWTAYERAVDGAVEANVVAELGVLMLARIDGKSPVEYVETEAVAQTLRTIATRTLREDVGTIDAFKTILRDTHTTNE